MKKQILHTETFIEKKSNDVIGFNWPIQLKGILACLLPHKYWSSTGNSEKREQMKMIKSKIQENTAAHTYNGKSMNVVILTQDDPFFLAKNLDYLFSILPAPINITGCVLFKASPFGKKGGFFTKIRRTWDIFGTGFLLNYGFRYILNKFKRRTKVSYVLKKHSIPIIELTESVNAPSSLVRILSCKPDLLVSIAGNQIFKKDLINLAPEGCLNLHTALLPRYRGLMPSFWALKNGEKETGVSVFMVDEGIDSGPILVQRRIRINGWSQKELIEHSKKIGMNAMAEAIHKVYKGDYELMPNDDWESTYYSFPTKKDVQEFKRKGKRFY